MDGLLSDFGRAFSKVLEDLLRLCVLDFGGSWEDHIPLIEFAYNNSFQSSIGMASYEALPMKGVSRFGIVSKLSPRHVGPFEILERIDKSAYRLLLSDQMSDVHNVFHVSTLRKWISDSRKKVSADEVEIQENLRYKEEPELILAYDVRRHFSEVGEIVKITFAPGSSGTKLDRPRTIGTGCAINLDPEQFVWTKFGLFVRYDSVDLISVLSDSVLISVRILSDVVVWILRILIGVLKANSKARSWNQFSQFEFGHDPMRAGSVPVSRTNRQVLKEMSMNVAFAFEDFKDFDETSTLNFDQAFSDLIQGVYNSEKEAYEKYCHYAHSHGFSVRKEHHHFWPNTRKVKSKDFVCSKASFKKETNMGTKVKYQKSSTRTGCPTMVRFSVSQDGIWTMNKSIESHNHELAWPDDQHLLRLSRSISDENASILKPMLEAGIRTVEAFTYLSEGVGNLGFTKRDAYNYIQKERRAKIESGDTNSLIKLFKDRAIDDNMFAWDVQTDEDEVQGNEEAEKCVIDDLSTLAAKVHSIKLGRKNKPISGAGNEIIKDPKKCRPKGVSNARLKDHWERRKTKKVKPTEKNPPTTIHFTTGDSGSQSSFM
ncbi:hypothetical protein KFK09_014108 [Dendrobium nobile]|uniref:Protein FAR1-RELATED SEQUENCE n=1 Tax=Dendrobium nobile TaxID=94219 RepID=A0A8T3BAX5_DENNO|nr:hypothetical protein KFK09_014108 [Dendrobium nobile]